MKRALLAVLGVGLSASLQAQTQVHYGTAQNITGQLVLSGTVNLLHAAQTAQAMGGIPYPSMGGVTEVTPPIPPTPLHPPVDWHTAPLGSQTPSGQGSVPMQSLAISVTNSFGLLGLTHYDQRQSNGGNQFSVEPPNPSIATGNGMVLEGVNNAVQVYTTSGTPLLPVVLSSNQVFGVLPAIDRVTGINGVFPTDMRVFFDQTMNRFFIIQRAQDYNSAGNSMASSHLYIAVSQTSDAAGTYNIYIMDTTNQSHSGCPCFADYPQIGADQYGFFIATNEFKTSFSTFVDAQIYAISKAALAAGTASPVMVRYIMSDVSGYEFAIQPVTTPPTAGYFLGNGGLEYFVSTNSSSSTDSSMAVWAMANTSSLATASPSVTLTRINTPILTYAFPGSATQKPGTLTYGATLTPPGLLPKIDGGDNRVLSASYSGGRIYAAWATQVTDELGNRLVGAAYVILSPTFRNNLLAAPVLRQGYLMVKKNHLLRPSISVTAQGRGAVALTLVGPDYYPSAAFVPIDTYTTGAAVQVVSAGVGPEDGFTGYPDQGFPQTGIARWGDYSSAAVSADGSIWMTTEFIPTAPRTNLANWGTFIARYIP